MKSKWWLLPLAVMLLLTGCWDKIELENRGFVVSLGFDTPEGAERGGQGKTDPDEAEPDKVGENDMEIAGSDEAARDKTGHSKTGHSKTGQDEAVQSDMPNKRTGERNEIRFSVTAALPDVSALASKGGEKESRLIRTAEGPTVAGALGVMDAASSQKTYIGLTRMAVFGKELLSDASLFREAMDSLERNPEVNRKMILLAAEEDAQSILEAKAAGENMVGLYVASYYQNKAFDGASFPQDLEKAVSELRATGCSVLPLIGKSDDGVRLGGAAVISDFALAGLMDDTETRGYSWVKGNCRNAVVSVGDGEAYLPLSVERSRSDLLFFEEEDGLHCDIVVEVRGRLESNGLSDEGLHDESKWQSLAREYEMKIKKEISGTAALFQKNFKADGYQLKESLRKKNTSLYETYQEDWDETFQRMIIMPQVRVEITGAGSIR